ncbi:hypothetical protein DBA29_26380 [Xenophilus aerolatus]|nr:hypothetical protein [Xenophilus aerolatus]
MKSGETAGQATAIPLCRPHASEARRPGSRNPGRRRQPSGARERWKPVRGETRAARLDVTHDSATGHVTDGRGRPCSREDAAWIFCSGQAAFAASVLPRRRSRGGRLAGAPSKARRG